MRVRTFTLIVAGFALLGCGDIEMMQPPPSLASDRDQPPAPPPGDHDESFIKLPRPLSVPNAKRVITEATVFAPWGIGYGGRPLQALALNVLLEQTTSRDILTDIYRQAGPPGQLLALCGLQSADPARFENLSERLVSPEREVYTYSGDCTGESHTIADVVAKIRSTSTCLDIPKSKKRIASLCDRAG
jgi:hypothetical protein